MPKFEIDDDFKAQVARSLREDWELGAGAPKHPREGNLYDSMAVHLHGLLAVGAQTLMACIHEDMSARIELEIGDPGDPYLFVQLWGENVLDGELSTYGMSLSALMEEAFSLFEEHGCDPNSVRAAAQTFRSYADRLDAFASAERA